jgi:hypothetical protein
MSVTCTLANNSENTVRIIAFRGDDWVNVDNLIGNTINPSKTETIGFMNPPSSSGKSTWGWIYLFDQQLEISMQAFLEIDSKGGVSSTFGFKCGESFEDNPNPAPWSVLAAVKGAYSYNLPKAQL